MTHLFTARGETDEERGRTIRCFKSQFKKMKEIIIKIKYHKSKRERKREKRQLVCKCFRGQVFVPRTEKQVRRTTE